MKIIKQYILCITAVLCTAAVCLCCPVAESRTRRMITGRDETVQAFADLNKDAAWESTAGIDFEKIKSGGEKLLSLSPPPISTVYWVARFVENLLSQAENSLSSSESVFGFMAVRLPS